MKSIINKLVFVNRPDGVAASSLLGFHYKIEPSKLLGGFLLTVSKADYRNVIGSDSLSEAITKADDHNKSKVMELLASRPVKIRKPKVKRTSIMPLTDRISGMDVGDIEYISWHESVQATVSAAASMCKPSKFTSSTITGLDRYDNVFKVLRIERMS